MKLKPREYAEKYGKTYELVLRYIRLVLMLQEQNTELSRKRMAIRMNWLVGVESVEKVGKGYILIMKP